MTTDVLTESTRPGERAAGSARPGSGVGQSSGPVPAISFPARVAIETRKMVDTRSGLGLLLAILLIDLVAIGIFTFAGPTESLGFQDYLVVLVNVQAVLLPIVGVIAASGEWSQRTTLQTFALEPRRGRVIAAKLVAALVLMVVITAVSTLFAAGGHALSQAMGNDTAGWGVQWGIFGGVIALLALLTVMGVAFGLLLHAPAVAIVGFLLLPMVFSAIPLLIPSVSGAFEWIDFQAAWNSMIGEGGPSAGEWARIAATTAIWVVAPMVAGWIRTTRREAA
jgi:ABC-type transport system involved in multi-copper enzyme maturation permease subunit